MMKIKEIQTALLKKGYDPGDSDGKNGPKTQAAIRAFQSDCGLDPDGIVGVFTKRRLLMQHLGSLDLFDNSEETEHFAKEEFACDCDHLFCDGFPNPMNRYLLLKLEALRNALGLPVIITSGVRCLKRNEDVGGVLNSQHLLGEAADLYVPGILIDRVEAIAKSLGLKTILYEARGFCHVAV